MQCEADDCVQSDRQILEGEIYAFHVRLAANLHIPCVPTATVKGEDVSDHVMFYYTNDEGIFVRPDDKPDTSFSFGH